MKKICCLSGILIAAFSINSQVLFDENFDYPAGDSIGAHGWIWNTGTTNTIFVASPGLSYTGYSLSSIGNHCHLRNNGYDAYKGFSADSTGSIFVAFMINLDSVKAAGDYFFALLPSTSTSNYNARFYAKDSSDQVSFGLSKNTSASNPLIWSANTYLIATTYLVIIKYTFNTISGTDDEISAYIFTSGIPGSEPVTPTIGPVTGTSNDPGNIGRVALRQGSAAIASTLNIDGIRVFKSWNNIIGIKPISTVAESLSLLQNYPNPFNPVTNIRFSIPEKGYITLKVYDILGREVSSLVEGTYSHGTYEVDFNAGGLGSGIYLYRIIYVSITGKEFSETRKLTLVK